MAQKYLTKQNLQTIVIALQLLIYDCPALQADLESLIKRWHKRFDFRGIEHDERMILRAIRDGYWTAQGIAERTGIPYVTVTKRLKQLAEDGVLLVTTAPYCEGHGGDRSTRIYQLKPNTKALFKARYPKQEAMQAKLFEK